MGPTYSYPAIFQLFDDVIFVKFPDFRGSSAKTKDTPTMPNAVQIAQQLLRFHIKDRLSSGEELPPPRPIEQITFDASEQQVLMIDLTL